MEKYWKNHPRAPPTPTATTTTGDTESATATTSVLSDFDQYCLTLLAADEAEGWEAELQRYLKDMPADVMPETDIILWWQVCKLILFNLIVLNILYYKQNNRIITSFIQPLDASHSTSSQYPHLLSHASDSFRLLRKSQMIDAHA
jgi:hypothetical protein